MTAAQRQRLCTFLQEGWLSRARGWLLYVHLLPFSERICMTALPTKETYRA